MKKPELDRIEALEVAQRRILALCEELGKAHGIELPADEEDEARKLGRELSRDRRPQEPPFVPRQWRGR